MPEKGEVRVALMEAHSDTDVQIVRHACRLFEPSMSALHIISWIFNTNTNCKHMPDQQKNRHISQGRFFIENHLLFDHLLALV
jgi:hypothetical protein